MKTDSLAARLQIVAVVVLVALCWVVGRNLTERIVEVGDSAPDFQITTDGGKVLTRSDFGGKLLVLNFWATWCPPCVDEFPSLSEMAQDFQSKNIIVLGVSVDRNQQAYRQFVDRMRPGFQTALDSEASISANYGTFKYPETYIIDSNGKVRMKFIGPRDWADQKIRSDIESLL